MGASPFETPPDMQALALAQELGRNSSNVMAFLDERLVSKVTKMRIQDEYATTVQAVQETRHSADLREGLLSEVSQGCWRGDATDIQVRLFKAGEFNHVDGSAMEGIKKHHIDDVILVYDVDEDGHFNRGYAVNQRVVDESNPEDKALLVVLDKIFHSWLVTNDMAADDTGVVFHRTKQGELKEKIKREDILGLIEDPEKGLRSTVDKLDPNIKLSLVWTPPDVQAEVMTEHVSDQPSDTGGVQPI